MNSSNRFSRVLSLKDKRLPPSKTRPPPPDFYGLFTLESDAKKLSKDEEKKVQEISQNLNALGNNHVPDARIAYSLRAHAVGGDVTKAMDLIMLFEDSVGGVLRPFNPQIKHLGAENRQKVSCWVDSLLFAMYFVSNVFEALLYKEYQHDNPLKRLVITLRLWVNMLRSGRLITTDITRHLQEALAGAGWPEAAQIKQQDTSEAFGFITDKLDLPLLTLKTDIFHAGSDDDDDHRFITERLLDVAVPEDAPQDGVVSLESCLEEYFNNKVEIKRDLKRRTTMRSVASTMEKGADVHIEQKEITDQESRSNTPQPKAAVPPGVARPSLLHGRAPSIFSERKVDIVQGVDKEDRGGVQQNDGRQRGGSMRKEVLMPAWQFLNLIPWYTDNNKDADAHIKAHFSSKRPMLGICLKRYTISKEGNPCRLKTRIDIPLEMIPPHFAAEGQDQDDGASTNLKLTLQAVVCHRGPHVTSGHYIALVRDSSSSANDVWWRIDDIANDRVTTIDIKQALQSEWPYLLFYQVLPIDHQEPFEMPPPYSEPGEPLPHMGEKLAGLQTLNRSSLDAPDWTSRRASMAPSDSSQSRNSDAIAQTTVISTRSSNAARTEPVPPMPGTSSDETKSDGTTGNRTQQRTKDSRPNSVASDKMFSRIASRLSRDKLADAEVTTAEIPDDSASFKEQKGKVKERKQKHKGLSRGGSLKKSKKKAPDRECIMM